MKGQLSRMQDLRQDAVESRLSSLGAALALLEHDALRVQQAIHRQSGIEALLSPVLEDIQRVTHAIRAAQSLLREDWEIGQENRWNDD